MRQGELEAAVNRFTRAFEILPTFGHAYYAQALALADLQRYDEAKTQMQSAINIYVSQERTQWANIAQRQLNVIENLKP